MSRKSYISFILAAAFIVIGNISSFAQFAPVSGTVELKKADGTREPVAGAVIDVYRTDMNARSPSAKTGKKGDFAFAGLQLGAEFTFAVSAPNCAPSIFPHVKAGQDKLVLILTPGDGSKLSEADARKGIAAQASAGNSTGTAAPTELTAEQKKAQADYEKQAAEVTAKNAKIQQNTEIIAQSLKEGNDASAAKNYDLAITKYGEGIAAEPNFVGSAPTLLNNQGTAYKDRAVGTFNKNIKNPDATAKLAAMTSVKNDFLSSAQAFARVIEVIKGAPATDVTDPKNVESNRLFALQQAKETFRLAVATEQVDPGVIETAKVLIPTYIAVETDTAKKAEANAIFADLYRVSGDMDNAILAYKKILETSPDNIDALSGVGLSLVNNGFIKSDKAQLQEGANYLQKFVSLAPDTNKYKADAVSLIETLKKEQNVAPQKLPPSGKKKT